jgi:hypothetical protein
VILWLTALAVGPALLLDLLEIGPTTALGWNVLIAIALWFGAPYYLAQVLVGAVVPEAPLRVYASAAAALTVLLGVALDQWIQREDKRRDKRVRESAT